MSALDSVRTLVLNADGIPLCIISWKRGICLLMDEKVMQLEFYHDKEVRDGKGRSHPIPAVVILKKYVRKNYTHAPFSRRNVLIRDKFTCVYCGVSFSPSKLTLDHIIPKSKWVMQGSPTIFSNVVTACIPCNRRKANHSCKDVNMYPITHPRVPSYKEIFIGMSIIGNRTPDEWFPYFAQLPPI